MHRPKRLLPIFAVILILGTAIILVSPTLHFGQVAHGSTRTISLIGNYYYGWNYSQPSGTNPPVTVQQGDIVKISLTSSDTMHQFALDIDQDGQKVTGSCPAGDTCSSTFSPGSPTSITITVNFGPGTYTYFCTFHQAMIGNLIVQPARDFRVTSNPTSLSLVQGSSGTSTIAVNGESGFGGSISLTANVSPEGPRISLNPSSVTIASGSPSMTSALTINSTGAPAGSYSITVTGSNGTVQHSTTVSVTVNVPDFNISSNPTFLNVAQGTTGTATITLTSLNGFSGTVTLAGSTSPAGPSDPSSSFSPSSVALLGGSATSTLTVSALEGTYTTIANGSYSMNITATSGSLSHSTTIQATVSSSNSSSGSLLLSPALSVGIAVVVIAAVVLTVLLVRRKPRK